MKWPLGGLQKYPVGQIDRSPYVEEREEISEVSFFGYLLILNVRLVSGHLVL